MAGFKDFVAGEILTAADVDSFLMQQTVMVFDDESARDTGLASVLREGMIVYLKSTDELLQYTGSAWELASTPDWLTNYPEETEVLAATSSGQVLMTTGGTATPVWQHYPSHNYIINGAFDVWQRGTSFLAVAGYNADRWSQPFASNNSERSTDAPSGFEYSIKFNRTSGTRAGINTRLESSNVRGLLNTPITISFWAKEDAANGDTLRVEVRYASAKDNFATLVGSQNSSEFTLSTTWQRFSYTITPDSNVVDGMQITLSANAINTDFLVTGVQLEAGSVATPFKRNAPSLQGELAACQRYYYRTTATAGGLIFANAYANSATQARGAVHFPTTMRVAPTSLDQSGTPLDYRAQRQGTTTVDCSAIPGFIGATENAAQFTFTFASGLTAGEGLQLRSGAVGAFLGWSAELL
jgi:hypothetical protein